MQAFFYDIDEESKVTVRRARL